MPQDPPSLASSPGHKRAQNHTLYRRPDESRDVSVASWLHLNHSTHSVSTLPQNISHNMAAVASFPSALRGALSALQSVGPRPLYPLMGTLLGRATSDSEFCQYIRDTEPGEDTLRQFGLLLAQWDAERQPDWADPVRACRTTERRTQIYDFLDLDTETRKLLDSASPIIHERATVISGTWDPWYTGERRSAGNFYWNHYSSYLRTRKGWNNAALAALDEATTEIVTRISDPTRREAYQTKGLVVGYVQSGKTANFTGVIAKAIDAGYRLIIVMTGTIELLRSQT